MRLGTRTIKMVAVGLIISATLGCTATARDAGRSASEAVFEAAETWWSSKKKELLDEAKEYAALKIAATEAKIEAKVEIKAAEARERLAAKGIAVGEGEVVQAAMAYARHRDPAKGSVDWDLLSDLILATGLGAGGVAVLKALLRRVLDLKVPVERIEPQPTNGGGGTPA